MIHRVKRCGEIYEDEQDHLVIILPPDNPLHEFHTDRTMVSTSAPHPQGASIIEPKYLNEFVHGIGTPAKQTSSLDPAGLKYSAFFLLILSPFASSTSLQLSGCCSASNLEYSHNSGSSAKSIALGGSL